MVSKKKVDKTVRAYLVDVAFLYIGLPQCIKSVRKVLDVYQVLMTIFVNVEKLYHQH